MCECVCMYLIGGAAEPGIPGGAAVPEEVTHAENGVILRLLLVILSAAAAAAAVVFGFGEAGDNSFLCLTLRRHCFYCQRGNNETETKISGIPQIRSGKQQKFRKTSYCFVESLSRRICSRF